jgi:hypothetical protein
MRIPLPVMVLAAAGVLAHAAPAADKHIDGSNWVGCRSSTTLTTLMDHARAGDTDAYKRVMGAALVKRECLSLPARAPVTILGSGPEMLRIRLASDRSEWWVNRDAVK